MKKTRILIADDHPLFLDGLNSLLSAEKDFEIVATASNGNEVLSAIEKNTVDICIVDINMPELNGIETAKRIRKIHPQTRIITLTTYNDIEFIRALLATEISGYILKNSTGTELVNAIRKVMQGETYFSKEIHEIITTDFIRQEKLKTKAQTSSVTLTPREIEIIRLLAEENTNDEIAKKLFISYRTVETHRKNIMQKTKMKNLAGLILFANSNGLLSR